MGAHLISTMTMSLSVDGLICSVQLEILDTRSSDGHKKLKVSERHWREREIGCWRMGDLLLASSYRSCERSHRAKIVAKVARVSRGLVRLKANCGPRPQI